MKRPTIDLMALTSEQAAPMTEATQRIAQPVPAVVSVPAPASAKLESVSFKVAPQFRKRFRQRAVAADLNLTELLFEALDAWERERGLKS